MAFQKKGSGPMRAPFTAKALPAVAPKAPPVQDPLISDKVKPAATPKKLFPRKGGNPFQGGLSSNPVAAADKPGKATAGSKFQSGMGLSGSGSSKKGKF